MAGKQKKASSETSISRDLAKYIPPKTTVGDLAERAELPRAKSLGRPGTPSEPPPSRDVERDIRAFVAYARTCSDEKGDAQVFCDRLFRAFGHAGYKEAGAVLEDRVKMEDGRTKFADLVWRPRVLIEMKKRGEKLARHYAQAMRYWIRLTPNRPRFVMLCNFDEFWIYDFNTQLDEPMDRLTLDEFLPRYTALNFMFPDLHEPQFRNNRAAVTDEAARKMGDLFRALVERGETRERAQRFALQCVVAMFSEDTGLLPRGLFTELVSECVSGGSSYDLLGSLFTQMNRSERARGGRFKSVRYFNGGIFAQVDPVELKKPELAVLREACSEDWGRINPAIFGTLFQESMESADRHRKGAHYTPEAEIMRVVLPTIVQPWQTRIRGASSVKELLQIRSELTRLRVLDPACGSGNFLYVAYRELKRLELSILERVHDEYNEPSRLKAGASTTIQTKQFFGIDNDPFAVELAKVTLVLAKKLAFDEARGALEDARLGLDFDTPLPLENLDDNIRCDDAIFCAWPAADAIIGNPPYQSKNKAQAEFGSAYMNRVRKRHPDVPGQADFCVYWIRRAHDELPEGGRSGLVGTNTIRENKSRVGGLDYIVSHGGTITEAVSTQVWPGTAVLHVSIVNWLKGSVAGNKTLWIQDGDQVDGPWQKFSLPMINSALSPRVDVTAAKDLSCNDSPKTTFQGQTPGNAGFVVSRDTADEWVAADKRNTEILFPYMIGDDLLDNEDSASGRLLVDFGDRDIVSASRYKIPFAHAQATVLPAREKALAKEQQRSLEARGDDPGGHVNKHHANFMKKWWKLAYGRDDMLESLARTTRYIVCSRVTRRPIFEFVSQEIRPGDALQVFAFEDDYSFGIFQSDIHWQWFVERCSGLKVDPRYTSETVYSTFPWPQSPTSAQVRAIATAGAAVRRLRRAVIREEKMCLRQLYRLLELPGDHPVKDAHRRLDDAVRAAYEMPAKSDVLRFLLDLNDVVAARAANGEAVAGPGLPRGHRLADFKSDDCVAPPHQW